jgi:flagellin
MATGVVANTNVPSISASRILANNRSDLERAMERLSSGKRINSAADDATGMAVSAKMRADIRSMDQAVRNANDGISLINTYDGAAAEIESVLVRMRELATQAMTATYTSDDLAHANAEFTQLISEIDRIGSYTQFNRTDIDETFTLQIGATTNDYIVFDGNALTADSLVSPTQSGGGLDDATITSVSNASAALGHVDLAIKALSTARAEAGAYSNRLQHTVGNLMNVSQRLKEALSGVEDADYAAESANLARGMVLAQAGTAMLAQANQSPQYILSLLRG